MRFLTPEELQQKGNMLLITNNCNLQCGGCNQMCPNIRVKDIWNIPFEQLVANLDTLTQFHEDIIITGGEPTTHPEWEEMKTLFHDQYPDNTFWVCTNHPARVGCDPPEPEGNISYHCDNEMRNTGLYLPTLAAPIDIYQIPDRMFYVWMARQHCWMLNEDCSAMLYNNKAYFCQLAGAFEWATRSNYGWAFEKGVDPFDRSQEEIIKQARYCCYRCAFCLDPETKERLTQEQQIGKYSLATTSNIQFFKRRIQLVSEKDVLDWLPEAITIGQENWREMKAELELEAEQAREESGENC